ncbi:hypothetical protein D922_01232 [Enterococcus faecalis 06-MB-DW-09]|nr:hypothetical protein D922_01232 [Enterococcus faecalis 06-MB-DW-09]
MDNKLNEDIGKVIRILSNEELLINIGSGKGVQEGSLFEVYEKGETITDPDTNSDLGTLDYIKAEVEAVTVYPNFSIVKSLEHYTETVSTGIMTAFSDKTKEIHKINIKKLLVKEDQITPIHITNKHIVTGDLVKRL